MILAGLLTALAGWLLGPRKGAAAAAAGIAFYDLLVGANPSVVRAAIMGFLELPAGQVNRRQIGINSLAARLLPPGWLLHISRTVGN